MLCYVGLYIMLLHTFRLFAGFCTGDGWYFAGVLADDGDGGQFEQDVPWWNFDVQGDPFFRQAHL